MATPSNFCYVLIPADSSKPLVQLTASTAGGFEDDGLKKYAASHFLKHHPPVTASAAAGAGMLRAGRQVDITLLSAPLPPACLSVSLYADPEADAKPLAVNSRASSLLHAVGHPPTNLVHGDAFLARTRDDERADIWTRVDLLLSEATPDAAWVQEAKTRNRGKNLSSFSSAGALQQLMAQQQQNQPRAPAAPVSKASDQRVAEEKTKHTGVASSSDSTLAPIGWHSGADNTYAWRVPDGSSDEVEVRVPVPPGTRAKDITVVLTQQRIGVRTAPTPGAAVAVPASPLGAPDGAALAFRADVEASSWQLENQGSLVVFTLVLAQGQRLPSQALLLE